MMLYIGGSKHIYFLLTLFIYVKSYNAQETCNSRLNPFVDAFWKNLNASSQVLQVFDISVSPIQASNDIFQTLKESLRSAGLEYHDSLAKVIADSVLLTLPLLTQEFYVTAFIRSMALYLASQNVLTLDNSAAKGSEFFSAILNNYPEKDNVNSYTLSRALCVGIVDFLKAQGESTLQNTASALMTISTHMFARSPISKPLIEVTVVSPPGRIPAAADVYGITSFSSTFLNAVDSSLALQSIFYSNLTAFELSNAWENVSNIFCSSIGCYCQKGYKFHLALLSTYDYMSKSTYVKCIANAYALTMIAKGKAKVNLSEAQLLATTMEAILKDLPDNSHFENRLGVIFTAFKNLLGPDDIIVNLYPFFGINIQWEFFAAVPVRLTRRL